MQKDELSFSSSFFKYLIFENLTEIHTGEATILGQLVNQCPGQTILVSQISFNPTATLTPTPEMFDDIGNLPHE